MDTVYQSRQRFGEVHSNAEAAYYSRSGGSVNVFFRSRRTGRHANGYIAPDDRQRTCRKSDDIVGIRDICLGSPFYRKRCSCRGSSMIVSGYRIGIFVIVFQILLFLVVTYQSRKNYFKVGGIVFGVILSFGVLYDPLQRGGSYRQLSRNGGNIVVAFIVRIIRGHVITAHVQNFAVRARYRKRARSNQVSEAFVRRKSRTLRQNRSKRRQRSSVYRFRRRHRNRNRSFRDDDQITAVSRFVGRVGNIVIFVADAGIDIHDVFLPGRTEFIGQPRKSCVRHIQRVACRQSVRTVSEPGIIGQIAVIEDFIGRFFRVYGNGFFDYFKGHRVGKIVIVFAADPEIDKVQACVL